MARDQFGLSRPLKGRDLLPEVVGHCVRRRVAVMRAPMHLTAGDDIYPGDLLLKDGGLRCSQLRIGKIRLAKLTHGNEAIEALVPTRNAVGTNDCGSVLGIHDSPKFLAQTL